jgi:PAS domain S-box-containing protein
MGEIMSIPLSIPSNDAVGQIMCENGIYQLLLDHFPGVAGLMKKTTREVVLSNQAAKDIGMVCGSTCFKTWGQSQVPCLWCMGEDLWATGKEQCVEIEVGDKVYEAHWVSVTDDLYFHYSFDITDRISTQKRLQENENVIQQVLSVSSLFTFDWDVPTGNVIRSDSCKNVFGVDHAVLAKSNAQKFFEYIHPEDRAKLGKLVSALTPTADTYATEFRLGLSDGNWVTLDVNSRAYFDSSGKIARIVGVAVDITKRKKAEDDLLEKKAFLEAALSSMTDAVFISNVDGDFVELNDAFATFHKFRNKEECSKKLVDYPDILDVFMDNGKLAPLDMWAVPRALRGETVNNAEYTLHRKDTDETWIGSYSFGPIRNNDGLIIGSVVIGRDITELRQAEKEKATLEAQFLQAQKMESVGRLAGGVAHDFNNMLTIILGHAELGLMNLEPGHPVCDDFIEISKTAERSADLTRQLLAFARKQTIAPKVMDLNETTTSLLKMLQRLIGEDIHLKWHPAAELWKVNVDPTQIDQILANLCVNARDAIKNTGKITIETANSSFDKEYCDANYGFIPGEYVLLAVSDDGCGMDRETQAQIFEPFFTTKALGEGTGLGLATVYGIVKQNNGFIKVYSEPDLGTTFKIYLPHYGGNVGQDQQKAPVSALVHGQETILLVEDEAGILNMTKSLLEKYGYKVLTASTPNEAITLVKDYDGVIDLLLTDVVMPEMNGRELAKKLSVFNSQLKCLYMSGYTANVIAHHGVLDKDVSFIPKPFSAQNLASKVREVLDDELEANLNGPKSSDAY